MRPKIIFFVSVFFFALCFTTPILAQENEIAPQEWQVFIDDAPMDFETFQTLSVQDYGTYFLDLFFEKITQPMRLFSKLCGVLIVCTVLRCVAQDLAINPTARLMETITALACFSIACPILLSLLEHTQTTLQDCRSYLIAFIPVFSGAMISCGQAGTAGIYNGIFFGASTLMADLLCRFILPLTRILVALRATSATGAPVDADGAAQALERWIKWVLTLCATLFTAVLGMQSALAQSADALALKTGKFLVSSGVPVVGRAMSDAMGSVLSSLKLIKGTLGFAAIVAMAAVFVPLLVQCMSYHITFSFAGIVAASTGNENAAKLLKGIANCVSLYLSVVFLFWVLTSAATLLMILIGSGG